ncbi:MAG: M1 family metallopeptidase [Rhodothermales bacterium]
MKILAVLLLAAFVLLNAPCSAQRSHPSLATESGGVLLPEQAAFDVIFYDIEMGVMPSTQRIGGSVVVHVRIVNSTETLLLDLDDRLGVRRVEVQRDDGSWLPASFDRPPAQIRVNLMPAARAGEKIAARVTYGGEPKVAPNPPWIGGFTWARTPDGLPWVATSVQMDGADLWIPVKDHPSDKPDSVRLAITVPEGLVVASNGRLIDVSSQNDSTRFEWFTRLPISNYNIALNIAPYSLIEEEMESIDGTVFPFKFWVLPEREEDGRERLTQFRREMAWYEDLLGPYPFRAEKYGVAHTPHLGMEHQTIIAYGSTFSDNLWGYDWLHHHELGHEWWANLVTAPDWSDFWIHEGFCTYMQALYVEHLHGGSAYRQEMNTYRHNINNLQPVAPRQPQSTTDMYFVEEGGMSDGDIYYKGAWILHTLRFLIGDDAFFESLRRFAYPDDQARRRTDGSQVRFVTTEDYRDLVEDISGQQLDWFFDVYLRQPELPELDAERNGGQLKLRWLTPDRLPFSMPVEIEVDGERRRVEMADGRAVIEVPEDVSVEVDPESWLLMR